MASVVMSTRTFASKRWFVVAAWILAAVVAGCFNLMQFSSFSYIPNSPRTRATVRAASGDAAVTVAVPEVTVQKQRPAYHKLKTQKEQLAEMFGGIVAGGATAVMLFASAAATISILNPSSRVASESAGPSVVVPVAKREVSSTPLASKAVEAVATLAPRADGGLLAAIMQRAKTVVVAPAVPTSIAPAVETRANTVIVAPAAETSIAPAVEKPTVVARLIAALAPEVAASSVAEDAVEVKAARFVREKVAPAETPQAASHKNSHEMNTFYGYQKPTSLYGANK